MEKNHIDNRTGVVPTMEALVNGVIGLVSLPEVCIRINQMLEDSRYSAAHIGKVISQDAALTARLLRIVNSAMYGYSVKVETVSRAITRVGHQELHGLVVAATVTGIFEKISTDLIDIDQFWRHGIYTGIICRIIAKRCSVLHAERVFIAGLLHDIGKLIMSYRLPDLVRASNDLVVEQGMEHFAAENRVFGYDHAEVGSELMLQWGFPESHQLTAKNHHAPLSAESFVLESTIVYLSDRIAHLAEEGEYDLASLHDIPPSIWELAQMSVGHVDTVLIEAREQFIEALHLFRPRQSPSSHNVA